MADILKISTPLVERLPAAATRAVENATATVPFDLSDVTRVLQPGDTNEILQQNTGYVPQDAETPKILADLLKDPAVTAGLIRNIYLLQEVLNLLPAGNTALTEEIEQLFDALMLKPEQLVDELMRQEQTTTLFKGEVFDALRAVVAQYGDAPNVTTAVGVLLKALNAYMGRQDALNSVAGNLTFLADSLDASVRLNEKLTALAGAFRAPDASEKFEALKQQVGDVLKEVQNSILYTPKMEKILPLVQYNLSRYNDNDDFLPQALAYLLQTLDAAAPTADVGQMNDYKMGLVEKLQAFIDKFAPAGGAGAARRAEGESQIINTLAKLIGKQAKLDDDRELLSSDKIDKIIHSMLASPSNFTPLLHFILPLEIFDLQAFAEIWVDPNPEDERPPDGGPADGTHMLMVFDVEEVGRFESELIVQGKRIALSLLVPPPYVEAFEGVGPALRSAVAHTGYSFETINIGRLTRTHSLMEVFTDLPHRRMGMDVKV